MKYGPVFWAAVAFVGAYTIGQDRFAIPERVAAISARHENSTLWKEKALTRLEPQVLSRAQWQEVLSDVTAAVVNREKDGTTPPQKSRSMSLSERVLRDLPAWRHPKIEWGDEVGLDGAGVGGVVPFDYGGIVSGRVLRDSYLNSMRLSFRMPGEWETVDEEGNVTHRNQLTFTGIDPYVLPSVLQEVFPLFEEHALALNEAFVNLLTHLNLDYFGREREDLLEEYTHRVCRAFDENGAVPEGYACSGYRP